MVNPPPIIQKTLFLYIGDKSAGLRGDKIINNTLSGIHQLRNFLQEMKVDSFVKEKGIANTKSGIKIIRV